MVQITSSTGIVSGIDYATLIDNLMEFNSTARKAITSQNTILTSKQTALTALMANLTALKSVTNTLAKTSLYNTTAATSYNSSVISVTTTGTPTAGNYYYTALGMAQAQESISSVFGSADAKIGEGALSFRFGNGVDTGMSLSDVNGGTGFTAGKIKITDRSGTNAVIDLTGAKTIDDVLDAINNNETIDVTASIDGDRIALTDDTGESSANLKVQEVNSGTTADSLGLSGINVASNTATGSDIVYLADNLDIDALNDGIGLQTTGSSSLADISYTLANDETGEISLADAKTIGEVIDKINASSEFLTASISDDGSRLVLTDSSVGTGSFTLSAANYSEALEDLGLTGTAAGGIITGSRIISGAKTVLLSSLGGGKGLGILGKITITDRAGNSADVDLSDAETLEDVIDAINASGLQITAQVNDAGNGIELIDTSGQTASHLKVENYDDGTTTAEKIFGSEVDVASNTANSGDMHLQVVGLNTLLADLNGGAGVANGRFIITDSNGNSGVVTIDDNVKTIDDVIKAINLLSNDVLAYINDTGDGIIIQDTAMGSGTLKVEESDSTTAADLNLLGTATTKDIEGEPTQVVDGSMTRTISISETDTLVNLRDAINSLNAGVTASIVSNGSDEYYLDIISNKTGAKSKFVLDTSQADISFDQLSKAQNALLAAGSSGSSSKSVLFSSNTNVFNDVLEGVKLTVKSVSSSAVIVAVASDTGNLASQIQSFVSNYNTFRKALNTYTEFNTDTQTGSALTGEYAARQAETILANLVSSRYESNDVIQSLAQLGISINDDGTLSLNEAMLNSVLSTNLSDVKALFTAEDTGISARFSQIIENLAGTGNSLFQLRVESLQSTIDRNQDRIDAWTIRLDAERTRLTTQFANLEVTLAKLQNNLTALDSISWITDKSNSSILFD